MTSYNKVIYLDISEFINNRFKTGIQRVIGEFLNRAIKDIKNLNILYYNASINNFQLIPNNEITLFLENIQYYEFKEFQSINLFLTIKNEKIFFDIDSIWNNPYKRTLLYPKLKLHGFKIYNFIYDLIPLLFPDYLYQKSAVNFIPFIKAVLQFSDFIFFDSASSKKDFEKIKIHFNMQRDITTEIIHLGSNFISNSNIQINKYDKILQSKYILFVGTLEPRKQQAFVLSAYEALHKKHTEVQLVFIGRKGWKVENLINKLDNHPLKDIKVHHLIDVNDNILSHFYKNAFVVTYISKYEGYGLPIAESLQYGNVTIISQNSSQREVGKNFVDYVETSSINPLVNLITNYIENQNIYENRKKFIKKNYKCISWDEVYQTLSNHLHTSSKGQQL